MLECKAWGPDMFVLVRAYPGDFNARVLSIAEPNRIFSPMLSKSDVGAEGREGCCL